MAPMSPPVPSPPPFLASKTRGKVLDLLAAEDNSIIYMKGNVFHNRPNSDIELPFVQDRNFMYMSGVDAPHFALVVDIRTRRTTLLAPAISEEEVMWNGPGESLESLRKKYDFDDVRYATDTSDVLKSLCSGVRNVLVLPGEQAPEISGVTVQVVESKDLQKAITEARVTKFDFEIERLRIANRISSEAHISLMRAVRPGLNERDLDALFKYQTHRLGCPLLGYGAIVCAEKNAATLHYSANNSPITDGLVLVDAGAEFQCYSADITRTYPANGVFSPGARIIYEIVLAMQKAVLSAVKPGVEYEELHRLAQRVCAQGLLKAGILKGELEEVLKYHATAVFFPHGLGHLIGLDTHDVGGYPEGVDRIDEPGICYLRMRRKLEVGMVVTIEPGCYFNETLIQRALRDTDVARFVNRDVIDKYRAIGGVRIEDCIVITETGFENLTTVAKEVTDITPIVGKP